MIFFLADGEHIIGLHPNFTIDHFLANAKVERNSYLGRIMHEFYTSLMNPRVNLVTEYEQYYSKEYDTFKYFLIKQYPLLLDEQIESICAVVQERKLEVYRGKYSSQISYQLDTLITCEEGLEEKLISFLEYTANEN